MKKIVRICLTLALLVLIPLTATAQDIHFDAALLAAGEGDLVPRELSPAPAKASAPQLTNNRETVRFSWSLDAARALDQNPAAPIASSKEYHLDVSAAELRAGVPVDVVAPGALVRINPMVGDDSAAALDPAALELISPAGDSLRGAEAMELLVTAEQMQAAGTPFPQGTAAFRLREELGAGGFLLRAPGLAGAATYSLHVLEPKSDVLLTVGAGRTTYLHGQTLTTDIALKSGNATLALREIRGVVTSPGGRSWDVTFQPGRGGYATSLPLDAAEEFVPGLWEAHVAVQGSVGALNVRRAAHTAFAVALPTARMSGDVAARWNRSGTVLKADVAVEVAQEGRYDVRGVLWGTDASGDLVPMGVAQTASWLQPGQQALKLRFDEKIFADSELKAPYRVRDLRLSDQGRMGLLHRQAEGFDVP